MKSAIYLVAALLLPFCCVAGDGFVIRGKVTGIISGYVSIIPHHHEGEDEGEPLPEKVRIVNGEFTFAGKLQHPELIELKVSTRKVSILLENTAYTVTSSLEELHGSKFEGGVLNSQFYQYVGSQLSPLEFISRNTGSEIVPYLTYMYIQRTADMEKAYGLMSEAGKASFYGQEVHKKLESARRTSVGKPFPEFDLTDPSGTSFSVSKLKGKIVVVDFWASWCAPCIAYIPTMRKLYKRFESEGVIFLAVSFDEDRSKWKEAMEKQGMEWMQGIVEGGFGDNSPVKALFSITGIPYVLVVDRDGRIAAAMDYKDKEGLPALLEKMVYQYR